MGHQESNSISAFVLYLASSSYVKQDGNFTSSGTGYIGSDIVNINGLSTNMTFGIVDKIPYQYSDVPINGSFGLHLSASKNNITSAAKQIVEKLDKPVITVFQNRTLAGNGHAQLTFGSEDSIYCEKNSGYVPILNTDYRNSFAYQFHLSTASATVDNSEISVELNSTVYTDFGGDDIWFTLNIGEKGNTKELVLTGADYIEYDQAFRACYLTAQSSPDIGAHLFLGRSFLKNHCFTYNVNEKTIAFSKAKNI
uniref:Peptidase A1 domain-containing protein n=1 Tax=Ditylenchus dipsaci TaxID=166011 RepID=A0A915CNG2_9BILA